MLTCFAPAKINLYLHITGRRADGYHLLDSLVAFVSVGDRLQLEPSDRFGLTIEGPMAGSLATEDQATNLVARAARGLAQELGKEPAFHITLSKKLPVASGIGGGSTDAAAALRLMAAFWGFDPADSLLTKIAAALGQDVPCCLKAESCFFRDIGNVTDPSPELPLTHLVLVNPMKTLPTPAVYKARQGDFQPEARLTNAPKDVYELVGMLHSRTNGLTDAACGLLPEIRDVLTALSASEKCLLSRMSGSGATCFGIYPDRATARAAAAALYASHPDWWIAQCMLPHQTHGPSAPNL
jgi:4-diphosphocytidyl-2-C-methyl-D-erythritol kinase